MKQHYQENKKSYEVQQKRAVLDGMPCLRGEAAATA